MLNSTQAAESSVEPTGSCETEEIESKATKAMYLQRIKVAQRKSEKPSGY